MNARVVAKFAHKRQDLPEGENVHFHKIQAKMCQQQQAHFWEWDVNITIWLLLHVTLDIL